MTSMASNKATLSDAIAQVKEEYAAISTSDLRLNIRRTKPNNLSVNPTTSTPFQIIEIKCKVYKYAGCGVQLKDGSDPYLKTGLDENLCLHHKEHDYVWIKSQNYWLRTFENKHFHVYCNCLVGRNPGFNFQSVQISISYAHGAQLQLIQQRLNPSV